MTMNPLPPQAYTKETLGKAFAWLQTQPENLKEFASSPDILVSLYLKAKMNGESALERPSIQNFKNELKSLAGMMGEFDVIEPTAASEALLGAANAKSQANNNRHNSQPPQTPRQQSPPPPVPQFPHPAIPPSTTPAAIPLEQQLDPQSQAMLKATKENFNLSSEKEALRLLIAMGHKVLHRL